MCTTCEMQTSNGDMAPRMGICNDTNEPVAYFIYIDSIIKTGSVLLKVSKEEGTQLAYDLLQRLYIEKRIYFCEDHFANDLRHYFLEEAGNKIEEQEALTIPYPTERQEDDLLTFSGIETDKPKGVKLKCSYCHRRLGKKYSFNSICITPIVYKCRRWWCNLAVRFKILKK